MNTQLIPIEQIDANCRLRPLDPDWVAVLASSMGERGQMTAIEVRAGKGQRPWVLVSGGHRLEAARLNEWSEIQATVFEGTADEAELREIDENLVRHELKELDRATFLARRKAVYERLHPEAKHGGKREAGASGHLGNLTARFTAEAAERVGLSERTISRAIQRYWRLDPDVREAIAGLWIADHGAQLDALSKLPPVEQRQVAQTLAEFPTLRSVAAAVAQASGAVAEASPDPMELQFDAFLRMWRRMPEAVRRRVRTHVNKKGEA